MLEILLSRYKILQSLASGGFGDTYLAQDLALPTNPLCVVKRLKSQNLNVQALQVAKTLFEREAEYLYQLGEHPQIPRLYAHFQEEGNFYLVQEFIDGDELSQELIVGKPWTERQTVQLLREILEILTIVHQKNIIHRDIKPSNIMRRKQDRKLILIDFGAVKKVSSLAITSGGVTNFTVAVGTPGYMPSEQSHGKPTLASDVYAVGMIGIQALTGVYPHLLPTKSETGEIIWSSQEIINDKLTAILNKMTHEYHRLRHQNAMEALADLNHLNSEDYSLNIFSVSDLKPEKVILNTDELERVRQPDQLEEEETNLGVSAIDWGQAIDVSVFYGRQTELETLQKWINQDKCRLILLLGMGGIGKTALSVKLAQQLQGNYQKIIWRSLRNAPPLSSVLTELVEFISDHQENEGSIDKLINYLRLKRCLIVLDNLDSILQPQEQAGKYRLNYEEYGIFLESIAEISHSSCLILTSREKPANLANLESYHLRSLFIKGCPEAAQALLNTISLVGTIEQKNQLANQYDHNPLALKIVINSIQQIFDSKINNFLAQNTFVFNNIRSLLAQQFERISELEKTISYWLALNRRGTTITTLEEDLIPSVSRFDLLSALESLSWRSLIETKGENYIQQPIVMEYVTEQLLILISEEFYQLSFKLLKKYCILKAEETDINRENQIKFIVEPLIEKLTQTLGEKSQLSKYILRILGQLQTQSTKEINYLAGNLLNLLCYLKEDLSNLDLSTLYIWQADFRGVNLQEVNFTHANLSKSVFSIKFGTIYALAFSPNNQYLATGHGDGFIRLWNINTGQLELEFNGHNSSVWTLAFSPDGETLASGSFDQTIKIWHLGRAKILKTFLGHQDWVRSVIFSPDGTILASGSHDKTIKLWETSTGNLVKTLLGHKDSVTALSFHPRGNLLASGSEDLTLHFWDITSGETLKILEGHTTPISSVTFNKEGTTLASSEEQKIKLWNVDTGKCLQTLENLTLVWSVAFSPDGKLLAGSDGKNLRLWEVATARCCQIFSGHNSQIWALSFSSNGQYLAASDNEQLELWEVETGERLRLWQGGTTLINSFCSLAFGKNGQILASGGEDGIVRLWDLSLKKCLKSFQQHQKAVKCLAFSADNYWLASGSEDETIWLWEIENRVTGKQFNGHQSPVCSVAFSPINNKFLAEKTILASGSTDGEIRLWDVITGDYLVSLQGHSDRILSLKFSPDGNFLASACADKTIKLWDIKANRCAKTFTGHQGWVWCIAFSPISANLSQQILASGSEDRTIKLWDINTGENIATLAGHTKLIWSILFSPDGQNLISGSADHTAKLWNLNTLNNDLTFSSQTDLIWEFYYSTDKTILAANSQGDKIIIINLLTGENTIFRNPRLYENIKLSAVTGITSATLKNLHT